MQRSIRGYVWLGVFVVALTLAAASPVSAQSVLDGRRAEFSPSAEHNAVDPTTGVPLVSSYLLQIFVAGGGTPVRSVNIGKPAPEVDGNIHTLVSPISSDCSP